MNSLRPLVLFVIAFLFRPPSHAAEFGYGAALREHVLFLHVPFRAGTPLDPPQSFGVSETALRYWGRVRSGRLSWETAVESRGRFESSDSAPGGYWGGFFTSTSPLERFEMTLTHTRLPSTTIRSRVENLSMTLDAGPFDLSVGRQPVSLGTSHFVGVLDVVAPFAPGNLDATYKPGVDAIRIRTGIGAAGEAEIIGVGARPWSRGAIIGCGRTSIRGLDAVILGGRFRSRGFGGLAWEGEVNPVNLWGELALFQRKPARERRYGGWSKAAFSVITGAEFFLPRSVWTGLAVMFQDFGVRRPKDLVSVYENAPYREGWVFLGSAGYALLTLHRELHPLVNADLAGLANLIDGSTLWQPRLTVNTSNNSDLSIYGWIGAGKKHRVSGFTVITRSEFGVIPDGGGMYARWFF